MAPSVLVQSSVPQPLPPPESLLFSSGTGPAHASLQSRCQPTPPAAVATALGEQHDRWHECKQGTSAERPLPLASCLWLGALLRRRFPDGAT